MSTTTAPPLVSTNWLTEHLGHDDVIPVDTSWMPGWSGLKDYKKCHIPGAVFVDITHHMSSSRYVPVGLPDPARFQEHCRAQGINRRSHLVLYDLTESVFPHSAPRAWCMFKAFGHDMVSVLNGGLRLWKKENRQTSSNPVPRPPGDFVVHVRPKLTTKYEDIKAGVPGSQLVDVRDRDYYNCEETEPNMYITYTLKKTGHSPEVDMDAGVIPGSLNLPYRDVLTEDGVSFKPADQIKQEFSRAGVDLSKPIVTTCHTGFTACGVSLAGVMLGQPEFSVYYGSWIEYAQRLKEADLENQNTDSMTEQQVTCV